MIKATPDIIESLIELVARIEIPKSTRNDLNINSGNMNDANNSNYNI